MLNWSCSYPCTFIELCACKMPLVLLAQNGAQVLPCDVCPEGSCKPPAFLPLSWCLECYYPSVFQVCPSPVGNVLLAFTVKVEQLSLIQEMM